ncbi:MAG: transcriptional repressor [Oscillatoriales cyanobacterium]|nr:MAG: transcriptional repressor [Oscillatoriales cyanobacterium]
MKRPLTRNQERILQILQTIEGELSAQALYIKLREVGQGMGLATVYRALEALKLSGSVQVRMLASGESLYSFIKKDRHHLNCIQCGRSQPIHECPVQDLAMRLSQQHRFRVFYHTLEFYGLCDGCASYLPDRPLATAEAAAPTESGPAHPAAPEDAIDHSAASCQCHATPVADLPV